MNAPAAAGCFHCGEPLPAAPLLTVLVDGGERRVCCLGCRAAAELIRDAGLGDYYRFRTALAPRPASEDDVWATYDRAEVQEPLLARDGELCTVNLLIEGLRCAACSWLIGESLGRLPGVVRAAVNPATARAQVAFRPADIGLGALLRSIAALGYRPHVLGATDTLAVATRERRAALKRLAVAGFGMMQVMMIATALYVGAIDGMDPVIREYLRIISLVVTAPVLAYAGRPFFAGAWSSLRARHLGMDVPVATGIALAFVASAWNTFRHAGEVYFDSVVMFIFLLLLGRYVEMLARHRAGSTAEALLRLVPATARRLAGGAEERVPVATLRRGDRVVVPAGECFPADGRVAAGNTEADESLLSGESLPVTKVTGAAVVAGALNCGAPVEVEITAVGQSTVLAGIVRLLERAQTERPRIARLADRAASWFVTRVLVGAALVAAAWLAIDPSRAFEATLAVLVVTCPCALSLATPTAITAATATLARAGLLVTHPDALEALAAADTVLFDKTGTLTLGQPRLERVDAAAGERERALALAAALERSSAHPLAQAFAGIAAPAASEVSVHAGAGLEGTVAGERYRIGTAEFVAGLAGPRVAGGDGSGIHLGGRRGWLARFEVADALRPGAREMVRELGALGLTPQIASGDHPDAVARAAAALGIGAWDARLLPADKLALLERLRGAGGRVLAVGDGINDAPILRAASVSLALGTGSALAQANAGLVALRGDLATLPLAVRTARRTTAVIRQNLAWSAAYNVLALPVAALGWVPPWLAAVGMSASSLLVVLNALRLAHAPRPATGGGRRPMLVGQAAPT
ncbi:MAG: cadmium-translocating P-type ATPase [Proteobacteria bacterium]|nr:cadmium-translocating P-type ATPase [Pseudomonadota bacterium]